MAKDITPQVEELEAEEQEVQVTRPEDLAEMLEVSGKQIRSYLRQTFPRKPEEKNTSWSLTDEQVKSVIAHFEPAEDDESDEVDSEDEA